MVQRSFGPVKGAGTRVVEGQSNPSIEAGALGVNAYTGVMEKGPIGKIFRSSNRTDFEKKGGGLIPQSLLPDAALDFYSTSKGKGSIWFNRVTDGNEKLAELLSPNRQKFCSSDVVVKAGNAGRWAGKAQRFADEYSGKTATTVQLGVVPVNLQKDELEGATVKFKGLPSKSFKVESNTTGGELTFASDTDLITDLDGIANTLMEVDLLNSGKAIAVKWKNGLAQPSTEFGMEVYIVEGGIARRVKNFDDLSNDPDAVNYFEPLVNDESDSDYYVKLTDTNISSVTADKRPANNFGEIEQLTSTVMTVKVHCLSVSSISGSTAALSSAALGSEALPDTITMTVSTAGTRANQPLTHTLQSVDGDDFTIGTEVYTYRAAPAGGNDIQIGADLEASIDNAVAFINAKAGVDHFVEKFSATVMATYAKNAGLAGNAIASTDNMTNASFGGATLLGGLDQIWDFVSSEMTFLTGLTATTGVAFLAPNDFGFGFTIEDTSKDSTKLFAIGDSLTIIVKPLPVGKLAGGDLYPDEADFRTRVRVQSNTANTITVKAPFDLTAETAVGEDYRVDYIQELEGGYDGIAELADSDFELAYDVFTSPLRAMRGKNQGLVKLATPGVTASAVQKSGVSFGESQNWQYRYEVPSNITDEVAAEEFVNATLGRNDFAVGTFPSFYRVTREGGGLKLITATGAIHGAEARIANDYLGYHKAGSDVTAILSNARALQEELVDKPLDEEFLNPVGLSVLKFSSDGNLIVWGDRTLGIDPAFKFKHHREQLSFYENIFLENFDFIIFALNTSRTDSLLKTTFVDFFRPELAKEAIVGDNVLDAINLKIDDEINTEDTRQDGELFAELSPRIVGTVEKFTIRISRNTGVTETTATAA